jgi:3-hydroxyacyl-[acyl-carrier-protein] dehydratase
VDTKGIRGEKDAKSGKASHGGHGGHGGDDFGWWTPGLQGEKGANWGKHRTEDTEATEGIGDFGWWTPGLQGEKDANWGKHRTYAIHGVRWEAGVVFVYFPSPVRLRRSMSAPEAMDPISLGLPHRPPFIFVESVDKLEAGALAHCSKTFRKSESFFEGHFPGNAIVPGVLLVEGMAQTAGIAVGGPDKFFLLAAIRSMKFSRPVRPEEPIKFSARKLGVVGGLIQCAVEARVGPHLVAEGQIILTEVTSAQALPE